MRNMGDNELLNRNPERRNDAKVVCKRVGLNRVRERQRERMARTEKILY